jgi:chromosome segregation ATPase
MNRLFVGFIAALAIARAAPAEEARKSPEKAQAPSALGSVRDYALQTKEEYQKKLEAEFVDLQRRLSELRARAEKAGAEAKARWDRALVELEKKRAEVGEKLDELRAAGAERWERLRAAAEKALEELRDSYRDLAARLSGSESKG